MFLKSFVERRRPARELDGLGTLISGQIKMKTEPLPELLGNERHERMEQPQHLAENKVDHREAVRLARRIAAARLACFEIPIAKLAPEKAVKRLRGFVEMVSFEGFATA